MNVAMEKTSAVSAVITVTMTEADYAPGVKKTLRKFCETANIKGFRPKHVPMKMAEHLYGTQAKLQEVNRLLSEKLNDYIQTEKLRVMGEPLAHEGQEPQDIEHENSFTFQFDVALEPEIKVALTDGDTIDYYDIAVSDAEVNSEIEQLTRQAGHDEDAEAYREGDILRGQLTELDEAGKPKEGGLSIEKAMLMPDYFKDEAQQKLFDAAKKGDVITFRPTEAYKGSDTEVAALLHIDKEKVSEHTGDFSYQVEQVSRFVPAELNQEFFDRVLGKDAVKSEEEFRGKIREGLQRRYEADADFKFYPDVRAYAEQKAGDVEFPNALLKRIMLQNNKDKDEKYVEDNFEPSLKELKWHLIRRQLAEAQQIRVEESDVKALAADTVRYQFAQYGMQNVPEEYVNRYVADMLKKQDQVDRLVDRVVDSKLGASLKNVVKLNRKSISQPDFQKMLQAAAE